MKGTAMLKAFWRDEDGGESAEWPLIIGLVAVAAIAAYTLLCSKVKTAVSNLAASIN